MLGERILDPLAVESPQADVPALGLLPVTTRFEREKVTASVRLRLGEGLPLLAAAGGAEVTGYEIHCGRVTVAELARPFGQIVHRGELAARSPEGAVVGQVAGTLVHGLFEDQAVRGALATALGAQSPQAVADPYEALADHFQAALDLDLIDRLAGIR
jgi:adenosylcobyric acid synthase